MSVTEDTAESSVRQTLTTVKATHAETAQLVKTVSLISIAIANLALRESPVRLTLMTALVYLVVMVAHALTG